MLNPGSGPGKTKPSIWWTQMSCPVREVSCRARRAATDDGRHPRPMGTACNMSPRWRPVPGNAAYRAYGAAPGGHVWCWPGCARETGVPDRNDGDGNGSIEVVPVVVLSQTFPARPSWIPEIRDFVRRCLAESPLTEEGNREVGETVFRALLDAAGPTGAIQVSFRIFPEH